MNFVTNEILKCRFLDEIWIFASVWETILEEGSFGSLAQVCWSDWIGDDDD